MSRHSASFKRSVVDKYLSGDESYASAASDHGVDAATHAALKEAIKAIFDSHKGRYGYRRVTAQLRRLGRRVTSQDRGCADGTRKEPFLRRPG
ncbi:IS3 family transposase (plasmid) [Mesorhizobium sp. AR10]|nr:IS3 family transposase [Mesorhizobium sp. AR10]